MRKDVAILFVCWLARVLCARFEIEVLVHIVLGLVVDDLAPSRDYLVRLDVRVARLRACAKKTAG